MNKKRIKRISVIATAATATLFSIFCIMSWPLIIASEEKELTGYSFVFEDVLHFDDGAIREGQSGWIYRIPKSISHDLEANKEELKKYPMWSTLAFDGYNQIHWQNLSALEKGEHRIINDWVFKRSATISDINNVKNVNDIWKYAKYLIQQDDTLISGWYTSEGDGVVDNYFIYIMNPRLDLIIKLASLT